MNTIIVVGYDYEGRHIALIRGHQDNPERYKFYWVWHVWNGEVFRPHNCPTWNDVTECKCMLAPEDQ